MSSKAIITLTEQAGGYIAISTTFDPPVENAADFTPLQELAYTMVSQVHRLSRSKQDLTVGKQRPM